ncbi:MAG TPA: ABC transporter permease subunit [Kofleriaceae bacterium]|nr:ABC transporter permease subunit [Kofleriaceae bacterium]
MIGRITRWLSVAWLLALVAVALGADCMASDRPLAYSRRGETTFLPSSGPRGDDLRATLGPDDWAIWPPIAASPTDVRTAGQLLPLSPPSAAHRLGTDDRGRDVAARLVHGARTSLTAAAIAASLATALALLLALLAVRAGGAIESATLALCDVLAAAPALLGAIAIGGLTGARGVTALALLVAIPRAADTARLVAASLTSTLAEPFVTAARAAGASPSRVLLRHALPHAISTITAAAAITAATTILAEAALSFLGLGAPPPTPSWGELLQQASQNDLRWWLGLPAGVVTTLTAAAFLRIYRR